VGTLARVRDPQLDSQTRVSRRPSVISEQVLEETVILDLESDAYVRLNPTGRLLWERLAAPQTLGTLAQALVGEFEIDEPRALADATGFVRDLLGRGLVELTSP
jgi:hypothetical protein